MQSTLLVYGLGTADVNSKSTVLHRLLDVLWSNVCLDASDVSFVAVCVFVCVLLRYCVCVCVCVCYYCQAFFCLQKIVAYTTEWCEVHSETVVDAFCAATLSFPLYCQYC